MSLFNYSDEVTSLLEKASYLNKNDVYDFTSSPLSNIYESFYQFCQENLRNYCNDYEIQPSYIFFNEDTRVNAYATLKNETYIISINKGTIFELYNLFSNNHVFKNSEILQEYVKLQSCFDSPIETLMFQLSTQFTYYHELGHLIQKSPSLINGLNENYHKDFALVKHLMEFDADLHAANNIAFHVLQYWNNFMPQCQSKENLERVIAISIASIFSYFTLLFQSFSKELYYYSNTHPHPLIRISYIVPTFIDVMNIHFEVNQKNVINKAFTIVDEILKINNFENLDNTYKDRLFRELKNVHTYIKNLIDEADKLPFLAVNKVHKKNMGK